MEKDDNHVEEQRPNWIMVTITYMRHKQPYHIQYKFYPDDCLHGKVLVDSQSSHTRIVVEEVTPDGLRFRLNDELDCNADIGKPCHIHVDAEDSWHIDVMPFLALTWDMLRMTHGGVTISFQREFLKPGTLLADEHLRGHEVEWLRGWTVKDVNDWAVTLEHNEEKNIKVCVDDDELVKFGDEYFELLCLSYVMNEWDAIEDKPVRFVIDTEDLANSLEDAEAAYRVAEAMEEQQPEQLEIIAKYMGFAADLGSKDAEAWLREYYEVDDQRYHPYV